MPIERKEKDTTALQPRRVPVQQRAVERTQQILSITAKLLEEVGIDDLTTVLIARELGISVGSLYHYFPNKHAILYALGAHWLQQMTDAMEGLEQMALGRFVDVTVDRMFFVYQKQRAVLPLAQALWSIPELKALNIQHDSLLINKIADLLQRLDFCGSVSELNRIGRLFLETIHALLIVIVRQKKVRMQRSLDDLKRMLCSLLEAHLQESERDTARVEAEDIND